jgi:hypothetical protein
MFCVVGKFHCQAILGTPGDTAPMGAAMRRNAEDELVRDGGGFHAGNLGATI